jgi:hypothetical protein
MLDEEGAEHRSNDRSDAKATIVGIAVATIELSIAAMKVAIMTAASTRLRADLASIDRVSGSCSRAAG